MLRKQVRRVGALRGDAGGDLGNSGGLDCMVSHQSAKNVARQSWNSILFGFPRALIFRVFHAPGVGHELNYLLKMICR